MFSVSNISNCRICGEVYCILTCGNESVHDVGLCSSCYIDDSVVAQGTIHDQIVHDCACACWAVDWGDGSWEIQAQMAADAHRSRLRDRYPQYVVGMHTCPVCNKDFNVDLHLRPGRVKVYCSSRCRETAKKRRFRNKCNNV